MLSLALSWLLGPRRQPPKRVPSDTVVTLPVLENSWTMRNMFMNWSFRFNQVMDADMLQKGLEELVCSGPNWRKLGGRFRQNDQGKLELHVPAEFGLHRPAVQFTREQIDMSVQDHQLADTVPRQAEAMRPCVLDTPEQLDHILAGPDAPQCLDDWLYTDRPALVVHVIIFTDATFITLTYSHSLVDGVGKGQIVSEWCKVLAGRLQDVKPMAPWDEDPMAYVSSHQTEEDEPSILSSQRLLGWRKYYWVLRLIRDLFTRYKGERRQRNFFIPAASLSRMRKAAGDPKLSDNQLLTTCMIRLACSPLKSTDRPIAITQAVDLRGFLMPPALDPNKVYLQNLVAYTWINTSAPLLLRQPLGTAAQLMRAALKPQLTWAQARAAARHTREAFGRTGSGYYFTSKDSFVVSVSSLAKAKYWDTVDFGPTLADSSQRGVEGAGKPVWQCSTPKMPIKPICLIVIQGRDREGNWWGQMVLPDPVWRKIEKEFEEW